jgi:hypothetical protein
LEDRYVSEEAHIRLSPGQFRILAQCFLLMIAVACASESNRSIPSNGTTESPATVSEESTRRTFAVPQSGTPADRVRSLWTQSRAVILSDAQAELNDSQYLVRREPLFKAWVQLQAELAHPQAIAAERTTSEVLTFIDQVYGYPGYSEDERRKHRQNSEVQEGFAELDRKIKALR